MSQPDVDPRIEQLVLYAWVGEDEFGTEVGIKQGMTATGVTALVSTDREKIGRGEIDGGLRMQARVYGKPIRLVRFVFAGVERELLP